MRKLLGGSANEAPRLVESDHGGRKQYYQRQARIGEQLHPELLKLFGMEQRAARLARESGRFRNGGCFMDEQPCRGKQGQSEFDEDPIVPK